MADHDGLSTAGDAVKELNQFGRLLLQGVVLWITRLVRPAEA